VPVDQQKQQQQQQQAEWLLHPTWALAWQLFMSCFKQQLF
jgi:hypothetical protein